MFVVVFFLFCFHFDRTVVSCRCMVLNHYFPPLMRAVIALINYNPQRMRAKVCSIVRVYMCVTDAAIMLKKHAVRVLLGLWLEIECFEQPLITIDHYIIYVFCAHVWCESRTRSYRRIWVEFVPLTKTVALIVGMCKSKSLS